ncbi:uncharacterized protein LOC105689727 [Athalia rosae]|uniref:uncharacterized protein LOC105689727 n=1 Tax=Athalia rosae TaxID=37344 RepID=UPI002034349F|nr:uncharacterized protein LOC105689727 [Athalia rosae]
MKFLPQLLNLLAAAAALEMLPDTFIQNHNVNIILNVDAKEIANELWKVMESHLNRTGGEPKTRRLLEKSAVNELELLVRRYVQPSRRLSPLAEYELAQNFEKIVEKTAPPTLGRVEDVVDDMMWVTKNLIEEKKRPVDKKRPTANPDAVKSFAHIMQHMMRSLKSIEKGVKEFAELVNKTDARSTNRENRRGLEGDDCDMDAK